MDFLNTQIEKNYAKHPFSAIPKNSNYEFILANYLAMSQAFPYLQAGSNKELIMQAIDNNHDVDHAAELTLVAGLFLCFDEAACLYPLIAKGLKALPDLCKTKRFHSNLLKKDMNLLFNKDIPPNYSPITKHYLKNLYLGLSSIDHLERVSAMVSFEMHADAMIKLLWNNLCENFTVERKKLTYFNLHVGDNPAEIYHVQMTQSIVEKIVPSEKIYLFEKSFLEHYKLHVDWCSQLVAAGSQSINNNYFINKGGKVEHNITVQCS